MITGDVKILLESIDEDEIEDFKQEMEDQGFYDISSQGAKIEALYEEKYDDGLQNIFKKDIVIEAFGSFYDDGEKNGDPGNFAYVKRDGRVEYESPIYLHQLKNEELIKELNKRGITVQIEKDHKGHLDKGERV